MPSAVIVVVPDTFVLPTTMLPFEPAVADKLRAAAVSVPATVSVPPLAESLSVRVPVPTFDV